MWNENEEWRNEEMKIIIDNEENEENSIKIVMKKWRKWAMKKMK